MNWSDERYVRLYTRDTPNWLCLPFPAQGLFCLILRKVDRAGVLQLGRSGRKGVAIAVGHQHQWSMLEPALDELLADGCVRIEGDLLVVPNFIEAQEAHASDKARSKKSREVRRDLAQAGKAAPPQSVTDSPPDPCIRDDSGTGRDGGDTPRSGSVTPIGLVGVERVETVTPSQPSRAVPSRAELSQPASQPAVGRAEVAGGRLKAVEDEGPAADDGPRTDTRLALLRSTLAEKLGLPKMLGIGRAADAVVASWERWLTTVGEEVTIADCLQLAKERGETPANLAWWQGWLDNVPTDRLRMRAAAGRGR